MSDLITDIDPSVLEDPLLFKELCWPDITFYDDQLEIIKSVQENVETFVPAGNMLGKDFISAFIALHFFCSRVPARVVTSSVDHSQLKGVLWGELRRFIDSSKFPLGLQVNDLLIRQLRPDGTLEPRSELIGRVAQKGEGMLGRHIERGPNHAPRTLAIIDEASGFEDVHYKSMTTWAHRILIIGNPYPCENFFKKGVQGGNIIDPTNKRTTSYFRKVIKIKAERSPNVRLAHAEIAQGKEPSLREVVPGVMSYQEFCHRMATWDEMAKSIGLLAEFYEGKEVKLYPPDILAACATLARERGETRSSLSESRRGVSMGVDVGEGGDASVWTVVDEYGLIEQVSLRTPDTSVIPGRTIAMMNAYGISPTRVLFDSGGGGKEHVDLLRAQGYNVKAIAFGGAPTDPNQFALWKRMPDEKKEQVETRQEYKNRRAEMYGETAKVLRGAHPSGIGKEGFSLAEGFEELVFQLGKMPKLWDGEGRMYLPPKSKPNPNYQGQTIKDLVGHSPDEADSFVLAVFGLVWTEFEPVVKPMF